ncbi:unnamed protein product, partial [Musa hybrid cultivar]
RLFLLHLISPLSLSLSPRLYRSLFIKGDCLFHCCCCASARFVLLLLHQKNEQFHLHLFQPLLIWLNL